jgi:hypothetical protein
MKREIFTDFDAFRATNPQLDGEWLINGERLALEFRLLRRR